MADERRSNREELQEKRLHGLARDAFYKKEKERHRLLAEDSMEQVALGERRLSVGFAPFGESEAFEMHAFFNCESCNALLLKSPGLRQWGCSECGLILSAEEANALVTAYLGALGTLKETVRKQRKWQWPWRR